MLPFESTWQKRHNGGRPQQTNCRLLFLICRSGCLKGNHLHLVITFFIRRLLVCSSIFKPHPHGPPSQLPRSGHLSGASSTSPQYQSSPRLPLQLLHIAKKATHNGTNYPQNSFTELYNRTESHSIDCSPLQVWSVWVYAGKGAGV